VKKAFFLGLSLLFFSQLVCAVDATKFAAVKSTHGDWEVIEFPLPQGLIYRISSTSLTSKKEFLTFDFLANKNCQPNPAVMVQAFKKYEKGIDGGVLPYEYKIPGRESSIELVNITMQKGDKFAFFVFKQLTAETLLNSFSGGRLAMWIPASGDGSVKRSDNVYFSMNGVKAAYEIAKNLCLQNK
jgi:hypothetical protein